MPLPIILLATTAIGVFGTKKGVDGLIDSHKAEKLNVKAQEIFDIAQNHLNSYRESTQVSLEKLGRLKLESWNTQLGRFVQLFEKLKNVQLEGQVAIDKGSAKFDAVELAKMKDISMKASKLLLGGMLSIGSGALTGIAAYGGVLTFGAASTGTAISALSGAAATNATLAWFGGGSLLSGGFGGMAGGTMILGGIVAAPVLAVGGIMFSASARKKLADARTNYALAKKAVEEMKTACVIVIGIRKVAELFFFIISELNKRMTMALDRLASILSNSGKDYSSYTEAEKKSVYMAVQFAQVMKVLLETPFLTKEGALTPNYHKALSEGKNFLLALND